MQRLVEWERAPGDALRQVVALDQFHDEGANSAGFFEAVNVRDVRMVQGRERLCFAGEPGQSVGVAGDPPKPGEGVPVEKITTPPDLRAPTSETE